MAYLQRAYKANWNADRKVQKGQFNDKYAPYFLSFKFCNCFIHIYLAPV